MNLSKALPGAACALLFLSTPQAITFYVSPDGDDNDEGSLAYPFATIQHGVDVMQPGDSLLLRGGVYAEHSIRFWGMQGSEAA